MRVAFKGQVLCSFSHKVYVTHLVPRVQFALWQLPFLLILCVRESEINLKNAHL